VAAALVALGVPAFGLDAANADASSLPESAAERRVHESLERLQRRRQAVAGFEVVPVVDHDAVS
jgi:hypothetical protein